MKLNKKIFSILTLIILFNCSKTDGEINLLPQLSEEVVLYNDEKVDDNYLLVIENGGNKSYLINKQGEKLFSWNFDDNLGNDLELLESGELLGIFKDNARPFTFGGGSGKVKLFNLDGTLKWEYTIADNNYLAHHDVEILPNGNILMIVWERITVLQAQQFGVDTNVDIFPEKLVEVNPDTNQIVWEWRSWDRLIQEADSSLFNYGIVNQNPRKINFNYNSLQNNSDFMHANAIDYDANKDVIHMSVNYYSEVWVIDHSTTTTQASSSFGGDYNVGGDLVYRYGNPTAYNNTIGDRLFNRNHYVNILEDEIEGNGNILIFINEYNNLNQSIVYELKLPENLTLMPNINNEPTIVWSFTDPDLYSDKFSGAVRLDNGNTLICEGDYGYWEVTENGEVVWKYNGIDNLTFWRGYDYNKNSPAIINILTN